MQLANGGKEKISIAMYEKGKSFIASFLLLRKNNGHPLVCIHLLCQGVEIIMKSFLLMHNYDIYKNYIKRNIGHNVRKSVDEVINVYNLKAIDSELANELDILTNYFKQHLLRYGSFVDILIDPSTISYDKTLKKITAFVLLADKKLA